MAEGSKGSNAFVQVCVCVCVYACVRARVCVCVCVCVHGGQVEGSDVGPTHLFAQMQNISNFLQTCRSVFKVTHVPLQLLPCYVSVLFRTVCVF